MLSDGERVTAEKVLNNMRWIKEHRLFRIRTNPHYPIHDKDEKIDFELFYRTDSDREVLRQYLTEELNDLWRISEH